MEQNEGFKKLVNLISSLETRLHMCEDVVKSIEKRGNEIEREIEEHFGACINALATRKAVLLSESAYVIHNYRKDNEEVQKKLKDSIEGCKKTLEAGTFFYKTDEINAENIWKTPKSLPRMEAESATIKVTLPNTLVNSIQYHGSVSLDRNQFSLVESVTTFAGSTKGYEDKKNAKFSDINGIHFSTHDNCIYVCDSGNSAIRKITKEGETSTLVQMGPKPYGIVGSNYKNEFFVTSIDSNAIFKISQSGTSVFVGTPSSGNMNGEGTKASFNGPRGITMDHKTGNLYVAERFNSTIRKITPLGNVSTFAGSLGNSGYVDGNGTLAKFNEPRGIYFDESTQSILVCDVGNNKLRRVSLNGDVTTVCNLQCPSNVAVTPSGIIFVTSFDKKLIYKIPQKETGEYEVKTLKGAEEYFFNSPIGIAIDTNSHCCFVAENVGQKIIKISFM